MYQEYSDLLMEERSSSSKVQSIRQDELSEEEQPSLTSLQLVMMEQG